MADRNHTRVKIGTAGWSIPRAVAGEFGAEGTALQRYAGRFDAAEINSSFHRPHRVTTWERWRDTTPDHFRFSVKLPKIITHQRKLADCQGELDEFLGQVHGLSSKLAILLVQLPPSLAFDDGIAGGFFTALHARTSVAIACEPRHATWFDANADQLLRDHDVVRVAADPALCPAAARPGGTDSLAYWRLHGSPAMYRSSYSDRLGSYADALARSAAERQTWCIFDNTASSAALSDALALQDLLKEKAAF